MTNRHQDWGRKDRFIYQIKTHFRDTHCVPDATSITWEGICSLLQVTRNLKGHNQTV